MMKTKHFLMGITAALLLCSGCEKEKDLPYLNILAVGDNWASYSLPEILANGGTYTISVGSNVAWTAKIDAAATWCDILSSNTATGVIIEDPYNHGVPLQQGLVTISATMIPYTATEGRTTTLTLTSADISTTYTINQIPGIRMGNIIVARTNVDEFGTFAENPASFGKFYQFNRTTAYDPTEPVGGIPPNWPATYISENSDWLPENDPCPPGWKMPDGSPGGFVGVFNGRFHNIFKLVGMGDGGFPMSGFLCGNSIETATWDDMQDCFFLPAVSYRNNTGLYNAYDFYNKGYYWTQYGLAYSGTLGTFIKFDRNDRDGELFRDYINKGSALPIRCVKK
jgi:hypothetical protein